MSLHKVLTCIFGIYKCSEYGTIAGTIKEAGSGSAQVNVMVKGTYYGTASDLDGSKINNTSVVAMMWKSP